MASGPADHAVALGATVIVAGVGCRRNAPAEDVRAAIVAALERAGLQPDALDCIATSELKIGEPGIEEAAAAEKEGTPGVTV